MLKCLLFGGAIGLFIPASYLIFFYFTGCEFPDWLNYVWPSSGLLILTDGRERTWFGVGMVAASTGINVLLYAIPAFVIGLICRGRARKRQR
jgi:hypothetical protein